jgi:hypothetical protein
MNPSSTRSLGTLPALAIALSLVVPALAPAGHAAMISVTNPGFESPALADGTFNTTVLPTGWSAYGYVDVFAGRDLGVLNPATTVLYAEPVPEGSNVGVVFLLTGGPTESGLQQTLADTLQVGMTYTLNVQVGNIAPDGGSFDFTGFPGYRVDLMAGALLIASDNNTLLPGEGRFLQSTVTAVIGASHPAAGQPLGIRLVSLDGPTGIEVNFDDVRLEAVAIPEPATTSAMVAGGLLALASIRRQIRRRRREEAHAGRG